ncbi:hypothetical protein, partial [Chamaesiphon sp. VAR_48_metabat_403]|uniref:hypothetical protein n=1 Tax=Chamaesiphon sp. VAR_48_metabat_403 TaxID=2964700 RepID=UPI00286E7D00
ADVQFFTKPSDFGFESRDISGLSFVHGVSPQLGYVDRCSQFCVLARSDRKLCSFNSGRGC